jgi:hypothetical protein
MAKRKFTEDGSQGTGTKKGKGEKPKKEKKEKKPKKEKKAKKPKKPKMADTADKHALYQDSVQTPTADVEFFEKVFREVRGRKPLSLREDFCGTAFLSATWVESDAKRTAVGIDIEPSVLDWGREHNLEKLSSKARSRVTLHAADVLDGVDGKADITCAMNFSYGVFQTRETLRRYFEVVYEHLSDHGMFFTELYGGVEAVIELEEERECEGFTYVWDQDEYNPITHHTVCHIHYKFPDGSRMKKAFTYDWRLWTIPELRELLAEVGFKHVRVFWETVDDDGDGTGEFEPTEKEENQESWLVYLAAEK